MQSLYEWDFNDREVPLMAITERNIKQLAPGIDDAKFIYDLVSGVEKNLDKIDSIIIMGVHPGASNQLFLGRKILKKIKKTRKLYPHLLIFWRVQFR